MVQFVRSGLEASDMTVRITWCDHDADLLRDHAPRACEASVVRRLLALALVLEGNGRAQFAKICGMDRQTLRDWIHRYNAEGIEALSDRPHGGGAPASCLPRRRCGWRTGFARGRIWLKTVSCAGGCAICGIGSWHAS